MDVGESTGGSLGIDKRSVKDPISGICNGRSVHVGAYLMLSDPQKEVTQPGDEEIRRKEQSPLNALVSPKSPLDGAIARA